MLGLATTNFGSVLLFLGIYAAAAARKVPDALFPPLLAVLFVLATAAWVRIEKKRGAGLTGPQRAVRSVAALGLSAILSPILILMPLFWLFHALPPSFRLDVLLNRTMFLLIIALVLTLLVNIVGGSVATWRFLRDRRRGAPSPEAGS